MTEMDVEAHLLITEDSDDKLDMNSFKSVFVSFSYAKAPITINTFWIKSAKLSWRISSFLEAIADIAFNKLAK